MSALPRPICLAFTTALLWQASLTPAQAETNLNPLADAARGTLTVSVHLTAKARQDGGDPGTWYATTIDRRLNVRIPMTALQATPVGLTARGADGEAGRARA